MKPNRWPYRQKKEADRGLSTSNIERIAKALGSAIHDTLSEGREQSDKPKPIANLSHHQALTLD